MRELPIPIDSNEESRTVRYSLGPDMALVDRADEFYGRAYKLLFTHQPSLIGDFVDAINVRRRELREGWEAKQKEQTEGGDQLHLLLKMTHQEPADFVEAFVHGLRVAKKEMG
jgi:hypothetical protein